ALAFNADGSRLASGGNDKVIHVWDAAAGRLLAGQNAHSKSAVSAAARPPRLGSTCGGPVLAAWEPENCQRIPPVRAVGLANCPVSPPGRGGGPETARGTPGAGNPPRPQDGPHSAAGGGVQPERPLAGRRRK